MSDLHLLAEKTGNLVPGWKLWIKFIPQVPSSKQSIDGSFPTKWEEDKIKWFVNNILGVKWGFSIVSEEELRWEE